MAATKQLKKLKWAFFQLSVQKLELSDLKANFEKNGKMKMQCLLLRYPDKTFQQIGQEQYPIKSYTQ